MNLARIVALKRICFSLLLAASMLGDARGRVSEKVRDAKVTKLIVETTILELMPEGKVPVKTFQSVIERGSPNVHNLYGASSHNDKKRAMEITFIWTTKPPYYSIGEDVQPEAVESLVVSVSADVPVLYTKQLYADAKSYVLSKMERFYLTSMPTKTGSMLLLRSETIPLNQSGLQNAIMGPFGVLSLSAEKIYGVYELHIEIKQVFK